MSSPSRPSAGSAIAGANPDPAADELVAAVVRGAGLEPAQARAAVAAMLRHLASRLPSPLFGALQASLRRTEAGTPGTVAPARQP
jgi:hypothetical protein